MPAVNSAKKTATTTSRLWIIDALRGCAVILMILYHMVFMIWYFPFGSFFAEWFRSDFFHPLSAGWIIVGRTASTIFLLLVGVSLQLSYSSITKRRVIDSESRWKQKAVMRGFQLIGYGLLLSLVTLILLPDMPIYIGVLSLIGAGIVYGSLVVKSISGTIGSIVLVLLLSPLVATTAAETNALLLIGRTTPTFQSLDYWPLFPYISLILLGVLSAQLIRKIAAFSLQIQRIENDTSLRSTFSPFAWLGSHSLRIYLLHIPILLVILWTLAMIGKNSGILQG